MFSREELISSPEFWFSEAQNRFYEQIVNYMESENINKNQLAERLGVTKGYVSQILNGNFNYTLKKIIDISLKIGLIPEIEYQDLNQFVINDAIARVHLRTSKTVKSIQLVPFRLNKGENCYA